MQEVRSCSSASWLSTPGPVAKELPLSITARSSREPQILLCPFKWPLHSPPSLDSQSSSQSFPCIRVVRNVHVRIDRNLRGCVPDVCPRTSGRNALPHVRLHPRAHGNTQHKRAERPTR